MTAKKSTRMKVKIVRVREDDNFDEPRQIYPSDAGHDLVNTEDTMVYANTRALLRTNIAIAIPDGFVGLVFPRSSTMHKKGLLIHPGIIDPGFRGEICLHVQNNGRSQIHVVPGERLAQLILLPFAAVEFQVAKELPEGDRGAHGMGSSQGYEGARAARE